VTEVVNLRQARKRKARADREATAAENRVAFGRTKAERRLTEAGNDLERRRLDAHRRDDETT
jgi:hypothetical protein